MTLAEVKCPKNLIQNVSRILKRILKWARHIKKNLRSPAFPIRIRLTLMNCGERFFSCSNVQPNWMFWSGCLNLRPVEHFFPHFFPDQHWKVFNWSWVRSYRGNFLQNLYFRNWNVLTYSMEICPWWNYKHHWALLFSPGYFE